jgi:hypothetical protein
MRPRGAPCQYGPVPLVCHARRTLAEEIKSEFLKNNSLQVEAQHGTQLVQHHIASHSHSRYP